MENKKTDIQFIVDWFQENGYDVIEAQKERTNNSSAAVLPDYFAGSLLFRVMPRKT
jgi:hypothetical protein